MKITPEDMNKLIRLVPGDHDSSGLRMAMLPVLIAIYERGFKEGQQDTEVREAPS